MPPISFLMSCKAAKRRSDRQGGDVPLHPSSSDTRASREGAKPDQSVGKDLLPEESQLKATPGRVPGEGGWEGAGKARAGQMVPSQEQGAWRRESTIWEKRVSGEKE